MPYYGLLITGKEVRNDDGTIITPSGTTFWVIDEPEGWVEATSVQNCAGGEQIPADIKIFSTHKLAKAFAKRWKGHPWWCSPNGEYKIFRLIPRYRRNRIGWRKA